MTTPATTLTLLTSLLFAGCAATLSPQPVSPPQTQYDAIITHHDGGRLSVNQLAGELVSADVIVIGEYHGHHGAHLLQSLLQSALYQRRPQQVLTMEQFSLDDQPQLDRYLAGASGESELIADTAAWANYKASYRPLVEFSRLHSLPVVAANAPAHTVRCVGREGPAYLEELGTAQRDQLPEAAFIDTPAYREKFFAVMASGHGDSAISTRMASTRIENTYRAQLLRDNTMAGQVIKALAEHPGHQVIHVTGTFHAEARLGMVAVLEKLRPDLDVAVVSPAFWHSGDTFGELTQANRHRGDYLYYLQPLPDEFKNQDRHREALAEQFRKAAEITCE